MTIPISNEEIKKTDRIPKPTRSSGSEGYSGGVGISIDEKKRRRMESNRESARRSRQKKQKHLDDLLNQLGTFKRQNEEFEKKISEITAVLTAMESQNAVLLSEKDSLMAKLEALERMIGIGRVVRGSSSGNNGVCDDLMMKPWQLPCYSLPINASSGFRSFDFNA